MRAVKLKHTNLSDKYKCKECGKAIKQRLVVIKETPPKLCYKHFIQEKRGINDSYR
tara:strand:+ start:477 stop:644 length:168 start_codon:yes stop_codon:yes gene_type:complete